MKNFSWKSLRGIFAVMLLILCTGLTACNGAYFEPLMTDRQLLRHLEEIYGEEFEILSSQPMDTKSVVRGREWTVGPTDRPLMIFSASDSINGSAGPIPYYYHDFYENYGTLLYQEQLSNFVEEYRDCTGEKIVYEKDESGRDRFIFEEDTIQGQLSALTEFINGLNRQLPFSQQEVWVSFVDLVYRLGENEVEQTWRPKQYEEDGSLLDAQADSLIESLCQDMTQQRALWLFTQKFLSFAKQEGLPLWQEEEVDPNQRSYNFRLLLSSEMAQQTVEKVCDFVNSCAQEELFGGLPSEDHTFYYRMCLWLDFLREGETSPERGSYGYYPFKSSAESAPYLSADPQEIFDGLLGVFGPDVLDSGTGNVIVPSWRSDEDLPIVRYNPETGTRIISGDKVTIDGGRIIVEKDGKEIIIDDETYDLSTPAEDN